MKNNITNNTIENERRFKKMVAGSVQKKKGYYYAVLSYKGKNGKRKRKWIPLGLKAKRGNLKKAEDMLVEIRCNFSATDETVPEGTLYPDMLFTDFLREWLNSVDGIKDTTYRSYYLIIMKKVIPYFEEKGLRLCDVKPHNLQTFYKEEGKSVKSKTVLNEHRVIHRALSYAFRNNIIPGNPADLVDRPKAEKYNADYYNDEELMRFFEATNENKYGLLFQMTAFYGLRRGEALGLRWKAIDFKKGTMTIEHTLIEMAIDGRKQVI